MHATTCAVTHSVHARHLATMGQAAPTCTAPHWRCRFAPAGSTVTCIVPSAAGEGAAAVSSSLSPVSPAGTRASCCMSHLQRATPLSTEALLAAGIGGASAIVVGTDTGLSEAEADASTLCAMLQIQAALEAATPIAEASSAGAGSGGGRGSGGGSRAAAPHVVAKMFGYSMRRTLQAWLAALPGRRFSFELLLQEEYASAVLAQVCLLTSCTAGFGWVCGVCKGTSRQQGGWVA